MLAGVNVLSIFFFFSRLWPLGRGSELHNSACQWLRLSCIDNMAFYCLLFALVALAVALIEINMAFYCLLFALVALAVALIGINMHFSVNSAVTCSL